MGTPAFIPLIARDQVFRGSCLREEAALMTELNELDHHLARLEQPTRSTMWEARERARAQLQRVRQAQREHEENQQRERNQEMQRLASMDMTQPPFVHVGHSWAPPEPEPVRHHAEPMADIGSVTSTPQPADSAWSSSGADVMESTSSQPDSTSSQ